MSSSTPTFRQRTIVRSFIRRNIQGWGRPLAYTLQRMRIGGLIGGVAVASVILDNVLLRTGLVNGSSIVHVLLYFVTLFAIVFGGSLIASVALSWFRATRQPVEHVTGTVEATVCNPREYLLTATDLYHFITLRLPNGRLRAFAIDASLHDLVCQRGSKLALTVVPGIEYVSEVA
jgi:hypothetical protein